MAPAMWTASPGAWVTFRSASSSVSAAAGEADAAGGVERAVAPARMERAELDRVPGGRELHANLLVRRAGRRQHQTAGRERRAALGTRGGARPAEPRVQREPAVGLADLTGRERAGEAEIQAVRMHADRERLARRVPSRSGPREVDGYCAVGANLARLGVAEEAVQERLPLRVAGVERQAAERHVVHAERVRAHGCPEAWRHRRACEARLE